MNKKFTERKGLNLVETNNEVLAEWEKKDLFHKSIDEREGCPQFVFLLIANSYYLSAFLLF